MRLSVVLFLAALFSQAAFPSDTVIRNVAIVDINTAKVLPRCSVLVRGGRIDKIAEVIRAPRGADVINGTGRYLMPGLWDMHVHLWYPQNEFPLFLSWGVTGVRDMGSDLSRVKRWRHDIEAGTLLGPHIQTCGFAIDGVPSGDAKLPIILVSTPEQARRAYDQVEESGVDFVKVLSQLPRAAYFALVERARKWGLPVAGDVPETVSASEAVESRQDSIEHLSGVLLACSSEERRLRLPRVDAIGQHDSKALMALAQRAMNSFDERKAETLFHHMALYDSRQVPTLTMLRRSAMPESADQGRLPGLRLVPASIRKTWPDSANGKVQTDEATRLTLEREYEVACDLVRRMKVSGVRLMAGTGTGDPWTVPGYELHRELELLVSAGLTPAEALRSATIEPAKFIDADESLGTVEPGKIADLVLLDANPLVDIRNTRRIAGVMTGGRYFPKRKLDALATAAAQ